MTTPDSMKPAYFEALYASNPDPWDFAGSAYERGKYAATLAALPRAAYRQALEIGCSIGVLTQALAPRCEALLAVDGAATPLAEARRRCAGLAQVTVEQIWVPSSWPAAPEGGFDLILLSEMLYYLSPADLETLAARLRATAMPGADIVLVHWTGATDYPLSGDAAVEGLRAALGPSVIPLQADRQPRYRLDVWRLGE